MRGFSEDERERIRTDLVAAGRDLFTQYGLRKTTIADLTDEVGIGTSTFYKFFDSKEDLYLAVLDDEREVVYERLVADGFREVDDPQEATERFLKVIMDVIETNPLIRRLIVEDELGRLREHLSDEEREADRQESLSYIRDFLDPFVAEGRVHGDDAETVAAAVAAIPYLTLHQEDIGAERYPEVRDFVVETFARGLADE